MERELLGAFGRMDGMLRRYRQQVHMLRGAVVDPHRGQGRILAILKLQPEITQRELSYLLDMRPQSIGELLSKLERSGYITRVPSEEDRRVLMIRLTEAGRNAGEQQENGAGGIFDCLNEEEQRTLKGYLDRITDSLERKCGVTEDWQEQRRRRMRRFTD